MGSLGEEYKVIMVVRVLQDVLREWNKDSAGNIQSKIKVLKTKVKAL